jgi:hypothetical protein
MDGSMLNRFFLALALTAGLLSPSYSAGTIGLSLTQRLDAVTAKPLNGGKLYFIQAGTTSTPQNAFQDSALTIPWPNPITLDAGGNIPQLFFADGQIKIRLTNAAGVTQIVADNILVIGPSSGGGGGGSVDPTTIMQTRPCRGFLRHGRADRVRPGERAHDRQRDERSNRERANADTSALFVYLWGADANLAVSRRPRRIRRRRLCREQDAHALPDLRGRSLAGLDDMGNSAAGRLSTSYFGAIATVLGAVGGTESKTLLTTNLPPYTPSGSISGNTTRPYLASNAVSGSHKNVYAPSASSGTIATSFAGTFTGTPAPGQNSTPFATVPPTMLTTMYIKL